MIVTLICICNTSSPTRDLQCVTQVSSAKAKRPSKGASGGRPVSKPLPGEVTTVSFFYQDRFVLLASGTSIFMSVTESGCDSAYELCATICNFEELDFAFIFCSELDFAFFCCSHSCRIVLLYFEVIILRFSRVCFTCFVH